MIRVPPGLLLLALLAVPLTARAQDPAAVARVTGLMERGRYGDAAEAAAAAGLHGRAGDAWLAVGRWAEARAAYQRAATGSDSAWARLGLGEVLALRGRRAEAAREWLRLIGILNRGPNLSARELTAVASALERLSASQPDLARDALRAYDEAIAADRSDPEPQLRAADLLLARYNAAEARNAYQDILRRSPTSARALLGVARTRRFLGDADPYAPAESALAFNPGLVAAHVFLAELHLESDDWAAAGRALIGALRVNPRSREALAVRAALDWMRGDGAAFAAADSAIRDVDPSAALHYVAAADAAGRSRRYEDAVRLAETAVQRDPDSWRAWSLLGVNRLRRGDIAGGRAALERAFRGDPFDLWSKNTLDLLDTLQRFPETRSARFRFVMDPGESALLSLYLPPVAEEAYERLAGRYGFRPPTPIRVEVYSSHADFSVRTVGLAGIGALGVCFGPVVAMDSPTARERGEFNWAATLWHEVAHVFHLERSRYRVPRWLTEGLAVLEERRARPGWGSELSPVFLAALEADELPPFSRLNEGFLRPRGPHGLALAYALASYAAEWLEEQYGAQVFVAMLDAYGGGLDTRTVADSVLRTGIEEVDSRFERWLRRRFAPRIATLDQFNRTLRRANEAVRARRFGEAISEFGTARRLFPEYTGPGNSYRGLAGIHASRGQRTEAAQELGALVELDESAWEAMVELASHLDAVGRPDEAAAARERALLVSPFDARLHEDLAAHYGRSGLHELAVRERRAVIALAPPDLAGAWYRLAQAHVAAGQRAEARRAVLRALEAAPGFPAAQELLLRLQEDRP